MKYIDIHCHLNLIDFEFDFEQVIDRANEKDIGMIVVGTDLENSKKAIEIAENHDNIWAIIGLHPVEIPCEQFDYDSYRRLAENKKVIGIGECGFDYYRNTYENRGLQKEVFEKQIQIANEVNKPLMLHLRNGINPEENAYNDALEVLEKNNKVSGNVHFFVGDYKIARRFIDIGFSISLTGIITFIRDFDEIIRDIPLERIMSETDSPYASPIPNRGKRNEPINVIDIAHEIARIRNESLDKVLPQLVDNARKMFSI